MTEEIESQKIVLSGRVFLPVESTTIGQDLHVMDLLRRAGIDTMPKAVTEEGQVEELAKDIILKAYRTGVLFDIMGGILAEEGTTWSLDSAQENAKFFENLTEPEDKNAIHAALAGVVLGFFIEEGGSLLISQKSTKRPREGPPAPAARKAGARSTSKSTEK